MENSEHKWFNGASNVPLHIWLEDRIKFIYDCLCKICKGNRKHGPKHIGYLLMCMDVIHICIQGKSSRVCQIKKSLLMVMFLTALFQHTDSKSVRSIDEEPVIHVFPILKSPWQQFPNPELKFTCPKRDSIFNHTINAREYKCEYGEKIICMNSMTFGRVFFCIPKSTKCQEGIGWTVEAVDSEDVVIKESICDEGTYQAWPSHCHNACKTRYLDIIPSPFKLHAKGDNKGPATVTCDDAHGFYNQNNKSFVVYDSSLSSDFCTNVNIINPCTEGEMPLYNGTCLDVCSEAYKQYVTDSKCKAVSSKDKARDFDKKDQSSPFENKDESKEVTERNNDGTFDKDDKSKTGNEDQKNIQKFGMRMSVMKIVVMILGLFTVVFTLGVAVKAPACFQGQKKGRKKNKYSSKAEEEDGEEFKKFCDNTYTQLILNSLTGQMEFVGALIINGDIGGTVFRVGSKYVMTAYHVIKPVIWDESLKVIKADRLYGANIFVNFKAAVGDCPQIRPYIKKVCYINPELDVAILELTTMSGVPGKMLLFRGDKHLVMETVTVIGFGNPKHQLQKHLDPNCIVIPRNGIEIQNALQYYEREKEKFKTSMLTNPEVIEEGYRGCDDNKNILFHGYNEHGASGAPILVCNDARYVYVVGVLTHGIPGFFFRLPERMKTEFPREHLFHKGCKMQEIFQDLREADADLAKDIFCC